MTYGYGGILKVESDGGVRIVTLNDPDRLNAMTDPLHEALLDEVSMGLAPVIVDQIFESFKLLASTGVALVLVEQYVSRALGMADTAYLMARGAIAWSGPAATLDTDAITRAYLGHADEVPIAGSESKERVTSNDA